jgi:hypothetical protein
MGDERKYITLGFRKRVEPSVTIMDHNDDLTITAIFDRPLRALL